MASSPTEQALEHLGTIYDRALDALNRAELTRVQKLLNDAEAWLSDLQDPKRDSEAERDLRRRASDSHARLMAAMGGSARELMMQLQKVREGRKILKTYGNRAESVGTRLRSQG